MGLLSARTIIASASLFHVTLAYFFLTNPSVIRDQALVLILGRSMGIPEARGLDTQSPGLAFVAALLILFGLSDLVSLSMPDEICLIYHWGTQAPLRFFLSFSFVCYTFFLGPSSPAYMSSSSTRGRLSHPSAHNPSYIASGWGGDGLKNRIFFTFMFVEMVTWFWIWISVREERDAIIEKKHREASRERSD